MTYGNSMVYLIKRFKIRKYYDYQQHRYQTFEAIGKLIAMGMHVKIVDAKDEDITRCTLLKVLGIRSSEIELVKIVKLVRETFKGRTSE